MGKPDHVAGPIPCPETRTADVGVSPPLDAAILAALAGGFAYVVYKAATGLNYHWNWEVIPQFLLRYDETAGAWRPGLLTLGLLTTVRLSLWSGLLAMLLGVFIGLFRVSPSLFKRQIGGVYVGLIRNTPPLVLIFVFYFFIGDQIMTLLGVEEAVYELSEGARHVLGWFFGSMNRFPRFLSALITLALFEAAYIAEIVRAGIQSVEEGQWEAAASTGMTRGQTLRNVILPQALQRMLPALAGTVYIHRQGLGHRFGHLHRGVDLPGAAAHDHDVPELRDMDPGPGHVFPSHVPLLVDCPANWN